MRFTSQRSWCFLIQNVYRRSLSSGLELNENTRFSWNETRKDSAVHVSLSSSSLVKQPGAETPLPYRGALSVPHSTANDNRPTPAVFALIIMRSLRARKLALAKGQNSAALSGRVIGPPDLRCQRPLSTNRRIEELFLRREEAALFGDFAPHLSHIPATF
jgi:hypothetical protein